MLLNNYIQTISDKLQIVIPLLILLLLSLIIGCQENDPGVVTADPTDDAQLIQAIQESTNKETIDAEDLPQPSLTVLDNDYIESYISEAKIVPELGYEVDLRKHVGIRLGEYSQTYFDLNGRELRGDKDYRYDHDREGHDKNRRECFKLVYPVTFIMPDASTITGDDEWEVGMALRSWYEDHPDTKKKPILQYPVNIIFRDGTVVTVNSDEDLKGIYARCEYSDRDKERDREKCFEFVYPITYIMPDGSEITVDSDDKEDWVGIRAWYEAYPDSRERPTLQYPVEIVIEDGTSVTINNNMEMEKVRRACEDDYDRDDDDNDDDDNDNDRP